MSLNMTLRFLHPDEGFCLSHKHTSTPAWQRNLQLVKCNVYSLLAQPAAFGRIPAPVEGLLQSFESSREAIAPANQSEDAKKKTLFCSRT